MRIEADYLVETAVDPAIACEVMAGEQSSGTFISVPGETPELKERAAARVESLEIIDESDRPSLPGALASDGTVRTAAVTLSWPLANLGPSLPNLLATITGNLFELKQFSGLRIQDVRLPVEFSQAYPGPQFSVKGTRELAGVHEGPMLGTIIKPSVGLDAQGTAGMVRQLAAANIDFIKDDELQADGPACPFDERARAVMDVINRHADATGKKVMFAFNITGDLDEMRRRHDLVVELGGTCIMASLNSVGLVGIIELGRFTQLPVHAHRNGWGYLSRHPMLGWSYVAWQKIWRLAGADHMHVNGLRNKFCENDDSVIASARTCLTPLFDDKPCIAMPVFSSGQSAVQAADTYAALGTADLMYLAGGGIAGHPLGIAAGVGSLRQAWEAAISGVPLHEYARERPELAAALDTYGQ